MAAKNLPERVCAHNHFVPLTINRDAAVVHLTKNKRALVDLGDWPAIAKHLWCYWGKYAARMDQEKRTTIHESLMRPPPGMQVDHRNRDKLDNRRSNLRVCTASQNQANRAVRSKLSGYHGVTPDRGKWKAHVMRSYRTYNLGRFDTAEEAARVRDAAAKSFHGEFVELNFPESANLPAVEYAPDPARRLRALREKVKCDTCGKMFAVAGLGMHKTACRHLA